MQTASAALPASTPAVDADSDLAYVQTYAKVAAVQLRSIVDALTEQVDKLSDLPRPYRHPSRLQTTAPRE